MEIFLNVIDSLFNMVRSEIQLSFLELDDLEEHLRLANHSQLCQIRCSVSWLFIVISGVSSDTRKTGAKWRTKHVPDCSL